MTPSMTPNTWPDDERAPARETHPEVDGQSGEPAEPAPHPAEYTNHPVTSTPQRAPRRRTLPPDFSISQFPTGPLLDISEWPTSPNLFAVRAEPVGQPHGTLAAVEESFAQNSPGATASQAARTTEPHHAMLAGAQSYLAPMRTLIKDSGIYALAAFGSPLASLVLAPVLTHYLSPTDFGILTLLNLAIGLIAGITQLGLGSAFFRAYHYDFTALDERRAVLASVTLLLCAMVLPVVITIYLAAPTIARLFLGASRYGNLVALAAGIVLLQNLTVPGFAWLRAESRAALFSLLSVGNLVIALSANILLVVVFRLGVTGSLLATAAGYGSVAFITLPALVVRSRLRPKGHIAWSLLTFGTPQVFSFISYWILQLSDRYLLSVFGSLAQAGIYAVAYSLGSVLSTLVIAPFTLAWPATMYTIAKRHDAGQIFALVFRWFGFLLVFCALGLSVAGTLLLNWLFPVAYHSAAPVIPLVATSIIFYGLYFVFMVGANVRRKTWLAAALTVIAAAVNLGLNLLLIPRYGAFGAASSTLVAYVVLALTAYLANQRLYPVPYGILRFLVALAGGIVAFLGVLALDHTWGNAWTIPVGMLAIVVLGIWLVVLGRFGAGGGAVMQSDRAESGWSDWSGWSGWSDWSD